MGGCVSPKLPSTGVLLELVNMEKVTFLAYDHESVSPAYENRIYLQVNLNEPCTDSRSGKLLRTAGWSYVERLSSIHVCILLESCTGNSLCKYLDSQMLWFELTFTNSPQRDNSYFV